MAYVAAVPLLCYLKCRIVSVMLIGWFVITQKRSFRPAIGLIAQ